MKENYKSECELQMKTESYHNMKETQWIGGYKINQFVKAVGIFYIQ